MTVALPYGSTAATCPVRTYRAPQRASKPVRRFARWTGTAARAEAG
jgi:hypothetical protein